MLSRMIVLAAFNARSQAYLQAMAGAGIAPAAVLTYGSASSRSGAWAPTPRQWHGIALPDLDEPLAITCRQAGWQVRHCSAPNIDAPDLRSAIREHAPSLVVFSGYAAQIVGAELLAVAPFLHVHTGDLPAYRGSTTLYYSMLERRSCTATAFLLRRGIDTGPVVAHREYPLPPAGMDVDRLYDSAVRADLLVRALQRLAVEGEGALHAQRDAEGHTYYVIHPVLKHIALLSLQPDSARPRKEAHDAA